MKHTFAPFCVRHVKLYDDGNLLIVASIQESKFIMNRITEFKCHH